MAGSRSPITSVPNQISTPAFQKEMVSPISRSLESGLASRALAHAGTAILWWSTTGAEKATGLEAFTSPVPDGLKS